MRSAAAKRLSILPALVGVACGAAVAGAPTASADTTLLSESFSTTTTAVQRVAGGTWTVTGGRLSLTAPASVSSGNGNLAVHPTAVSGDFTLTAAATAPATSGAWDDASVVFGYRDASNYAYVSLNESNNDTTSGIFRVANGVTTQVADIASATSAGQKHQVRVERVGSTVRAFRDGALVATATGISADGKVGFGTTNNAATFDDLAVTRPGTTTTTTPSTSTPPAGALFSDSFPGADGVFADDSAFWGSSNAGLAQNPNWFAEVGSVQRRGGAIQTTSDVMRMWTRRTDLAFTKAEMDVTFRRFTTAGESWHGINLWMNETLCTPAPSCSKVKDGSASGPSGYALDFLNRDGQLTILKKLAGDTRGKYAGAVSYSNSGTYYQLASARWMPTAGRTYRFAGRVVANADGTATLQVLVDGAVKLQVVDDGRTTGPRLTGGRIGLRSDFADFSVDDFTVTR